MTNRLLFPGGKALFCFFWVLSGLPAATPANRIHRCCTATSKREYQISGDTHQCARLSALCRWLGMRIHPTNKRDGESKKDLLDSLAECASNKLRNIPRNTYIHTITSTQTTYPGCVQLEMRLAPRRRFSLSRGRSSCPRPAASACSPRRCRSGQGREA